MLCLLDKGRIDGLPQAFTSGTGNLFSFEKLAVTPKLHAEDAELLIACLHQSFLLGLSLEIAA